MKKLILTTVLVIVTLFVSAQSFMVVTNVTKTADGEEAGIENITNRIGVGYQVNDNLIVGLQSAARDDGYDMFLRYLWQENIYVLLSMPTPFVPLLKKTSSIPLDLQITCSFLKNSMGKNGISKILFGVSPFKINAA